MKKLGASFQSGKTLFWRDAILRRLHVVKPAACFRTCSCRFRLSRRGRTIVFSIHQPRFKIFDRFDRLLLLGSGRTIFHGPASDALHFFESIGKPTEPIYNVVYSILIKDFRMSDQSVSQSGSQ